MKDTLFLLAGVGLLALFWSIFSVGMYHLLICR